MKKNKTFDSTRVFLGITGVAVGSAGVTLVFTTQSFMLGLAGLIMAVSGFITFYFSLGDDLSDLK